MYTHISTERRARVLWKTSCIPDCLPLKAIFCVVDETGEIAGGRLTDRIGIGVLTRVVPRDLVNEVLAETRRREKRSRLLPAHVVVYFVMAMAIFRDGYEEVMRRLTGGLRFMRAWSQDWAVPTTGAISQARQRLADRGFFSFEFWRDCLLTGADLLFRVPAGLKLPVLRALPDGSYLSEVATHKVRSSGFKVPLEAARDPRNATHIPVRVIEYTVSPAQPGGTPETFRLITTIMGPGDVAAVELAAAYAERWEYEISLREIETQMLEPGGGLRSKSPELLRQELWGLLLAHFAIRSLMAEAAASAGLDPDRLSFIRSISLVRRQVTDQAAFSPRKARTSQGNGDCGNPGTSK
jgi:hypothetical protein